VCSSDLYKSYGPKSLMDDTRRFLYDAVSG